MFFSRVSIILVTIICIFGLLSPVVPVMAQEAIGEAPTENVDAVLLLDASASMRLTDPERLRDEGAELFLQFLKEGDRLGLIEFDADARTIRPLTSYHPMQNPDIEKAIQSASDVGIYTDLVSGILKAKRMLEANPRKNTSRTIILLSDGKLEPDPEEATVEGVRAGLVYRLLPELKQKGIVLHTLALSEEADRVLLEQMALATDGTAWYSETAEEIHESFAQIFLAVTKPQIVPLTSKGFKIDGEVEQATFYINTKGAEGALALRSPSGSEYTAEALGPGMNWFTGQKFDTITIDDPEVGSWQIVGLSKNEGFATVLTNLKLITDWPASVIAGNKRLLRARLYDADRPVVLPEMTNVTTYAFQITPTDKVSEPVIRALLRDDGEEADEVADDGIFTESVNLAEAGEYQLKILAKGPTFERQQTIPFRVKPRLVNLAVVAVEDVASMGMVGKGTTLDYFRVTLNPEVATLKNITVQLIAKDTKGKLYDLDIQKRSDGSLRYEVPASSLAEIGIYELQAKVVGETRTKKVQGTSQIIAYEKKKQDIAKEQELVKVVVAEEEETSEEPSFLLLSLFSLLIMGTNAGTAAFCLFRLKSQSSSSTDELPDFTIDENILNAVAEVEEKSELTEVDLDDPLYHDDGSDEIPLPQQAAPEEPPIESTREEEAPDEGGEGEEAGEGEASEEEEED